MNPLLVLSAIWVAFELIISIALRSKKSGATSFDRNSILLIWLVLSGSIAAAIFISFHFSHSSSFTLYYYTGMMVIIAGMIFRISAMLGLKKRFTTTIAIQKDHSLKTDGLYKYIRHPSYSGSLISFIGLGISFGNWLSLLVLVIPISAAFIYRINLEEKMLLRYFGKEYKEYIEKTKRLIPFIF